MIKVSNTHFDHSKQARCNAARSAVSDVGHKVYPPDLTPPALHSKGPMPPEAPPRADVKWKK